VNVRRNDKQRAQRAHAKRRAAERFDLNLNRHDLAKLVQDIQLGRGVFVERQSHRVSVWNVAIGERRVNVVYDKLRKTIVTFLPKERAP
jgi:hypothetical protein